MTWTGWSHTKFRLWADVDVPTGNDLNPHFTVKFDVVSAELNYAVNEIPWCRLTLGLGREVRTQLAANIHWYADYLKEMLPLRVWMSARELGNNVRDTALGSWPATPFVVFDGYTTGTGFDLARSRGASFTLGGVHWLAALQFSSCLTNRMSAQNAKSLATPAGLGGGGAGPDFVATTTAAEFVTDANLNADVWNRVLLPWLRKIAKQGPLHLSQVPAVGANPAAAVNTEALDALSRFEPGYSDGLVASGLLPEAYPFSAPLALQTGLTGMGPFRDGVASFLGKETVLANSGSNFWDKLIDDYAGAFLAMLVPTATTALFVPRLPALAGRYLTVYPHEYQGIVIEPKSPRPLRAVCVTRGRAQNTGADGTQQGEADTASVVGGYYENPNVPGGTVHYEQLPGCFGNLTPSTAWGLPSANPHGVVGRADAPGAGPAAGDLGFPQPRVMQALARNLWDRYAQTVYVHRAVKDRVGYLNGRVRFDVAPGSTLRVVCVEEKFVAAQKVPADVFEKVGPFYTLYVFVNRVSYTLDAEGGRGETRLEFSHVRDVTEVNDLSYSARLHPLYGNAWPGGPLVYDPAFYPHPEMAPPGWEWDWPPDQFGP